jgi:hypothetical protein
MTDHALESRDEPLLTLREARAAFYRRNGFPPDGGSCLSASCCIRAAGLPGLSGASPSASRPARPCTGSFRISRTRADHRAGWWTEQASRRMTYPWQRFRLSAKAGTTITTPFLHRQDMDCIRDRSISAGASSDCWSSSGLPGTFRYRATCHHAKESPPYARALST